MAAFALVAQAGEVSRKPEDYPVRVQLRAITLAAENLGPSVPTPSGGIITEDYMVVEVAFFAAGLGQLADIQQRHFGLRINGARIPLTPDSSGAVAASIKYPDWEHRRHLEAQAGMGDNGVILGRSRPAGRFPGDPRPNEGRVPNPVPRVESPAAKKAEPVDIDDVVRRAALVEGDVSLPISGCLYFPFKGKLKSIKKLELVYEGPLGEASLRLL